MFGKSQLLLLRIFLLFILSILFLSVRGDFDLEEDEDTFYDSTTDDYWTDDWTDDWTTEYPTDEPSSPPPQSTLTPPSPTDHSTSWTTSVTDYTPSSSSENPTTEYITSEEPSTTTEEPTTTPTTPTTTERPPVKECKKMDKYGLYWEAEINTLARKPCPSGENEATWCCTLDGVFDTPQPDYSHCTADWVVRMVHYLDIMMEEENGNLQLRQASNLTHEILKNLIHARDDPDNETMKYYESDIDKLLDITETLLQHVNCVLHPESQLVEYIKITMSALIEILLYDRPWATATNEVLRKERISRLFENMENSGIFLTYRLRNKDVSGNPFLMNFERGKDYLITIGMLNNEEQNISLIFPLNSDQWKSHILLTEICITENCSNNETESITDPPDLILEPWYDSCDLNQNSGVKFLGISLDSFLLADRFMDELMDENGNIVKNMVINSKLVFLKVLNENASQNIQFDDSFFPFTDINPEISPKRIADAIIKFEHNTPLQENFREGGDFYLTDPTCALWDYEELVWKTEHCTFDEDKSDKKYTFCKCDKFAPYVLFTLKHEKDIGLFLLSLLLGSLSCICLIITMIILHKSTRGNLQHKIVIKNIVATLLIGNIFIVLFMDPTIFKLPGWFCLFAGVVQHFVFLCSFAWMLIMSLRLYKMVFHIFDPWRYFPEKYNALLGYGLPLVFVIIFSSVFREDAYAFKEEEYCWLKRNYTLAFFGPALLLYLINLIFLFITLRRINSIKKSKIGVANGSKSDRVQRSTINGAFSLTVLLILPIFAWVPAYFKAMYRYPEVASYLFTVLNASQGIFIFISQYLFQENFKTELKNMINIKEATASSKTLA